VHVARFEVTKVAHTMAICTATLSM